MGSQVGLDIRPPPHEYDVFYRIWHSFDWYGTPLVQITPQVTRTEFSLILAVLLARLRMNKPKWASLAHCCLCCLLCRSTWTVHMPTNTAPVPGLTWGTSMQLMTSDNVLDSIYARCCFVFENRWRI